MRTREEISRGAAVIYQGALIADAVVGGTSCQIVGIPDFLIADGSGGCSIRDSKVSRRINEKDHPEILLHLGLYGWLYEQTFGSSPAALEVHSGTGEVE